jgi:hypothetical protein
MDRLFAFMVLADTLRCPAKGASIPSVHVDKLLGSNPEIVSIGKSADAFVTIRDFHTT